MWFKISYNDPIYKMCYLSSWKSNKGRKTAKFINLNKSLLFDTATHKLLSIIFTNKRILLILDM